MSASEPKRSIPSVSKDGNHDAPVAAATALERRLDEREGELNSTRRQLVQQIMTDSEETYFLSSRELAKRYNVDVGTVIRTTQAMGYKRYADFTSDLRSHFVVRITPYSIMKATSQKGRRSIADHIQDSIKLGTHNLGALQSQLEPRGVIEIAKRINNSNRIMVIGVDYAASLSYLFSYLLVAFGFDSEAPVGSAAVIQQKVSLLGPKDLLIAISFGRCLKITVAAAIQARDGGTFTVGITDHSRSPVARFCNACLITPTSSTELSVSYVAPVSAIEAVLTASVYLNPKRTLAVLKRKE